MHKLLKFVITAGALSLVAVGCGGNNTYSPDFTGGGQPPVQQGDFQIQIFNGPLVQTFRPKEGNPLNSASTPQSGQPGSQMFIVVTAINGFNGTVHLATGNGTNGFGADAPVPADVTVNASHEGDSTFVYTFGQNRGDNNGFTDGTVTVTGTSGSISHTKQAFFHLFTD